MEDKKIPPDVLAAVGRAAFGHHWQVPLASALSVSDRHLRRWVKDGAPSHIKQDLLVLMDSSKKELERARALLKKA